MAVHAPATRIAPVRQGYRNQPMPPNRAYLEALLEGVPIPATKSDLVEYARRDGGADAAQALAPLPERRYSSLDEVGEALEPVQPSRERPRTVPRPESDLPPGGSAYGR